MKKLWATLSVVSSVTFLFGTGSAMAAKVTATPVVKSVSVIESSSGEKLWQKYLQKERLSNDELVTLVTYVSSDSFLENIHSLDRDQMTSWRSLMKAAKIAN